MTILAIAFISCIVLTSIIFDLSLFLRGPAPYPPDWRWLYNFSAHFNIILFPIIISFCLICLIVQFDKNRKFVLSHEKGVLFVFFLGSLLFTFSVLVYGRGGILVLVQRSIDPVLNSYFEVSQRIHNLGNFLRNYSTQVSSFQNVAKYHPPAAAIFYWIISRITNPFSYLFTFLSSFRSSHSDITIAWQQLSLNQKVTSLSGSFLFILFTHLTVIVLYYLTKVLYGIQSAIRSLLLYIFIPSIILFIPLPDGMYPFFTALSFYLFIVGIKNKSYAQLVGSGILMYLGAMFSLQIFVVTIIFAIYYFSVAGKKSFKYHLKHVLVWICGFLLIPIFLYIVWGFNSITSIFAVMANHNSFVFSRKNPLWLIYNYYDFFIFTSIPLAIYFVFHVKDMFQNIFMRRFTHVNWIFFGFFIMTLFINILGIMNGETGRTWLAFLPFYILPMNEYLSKNKVSFKTMILIYVLQVIQIIVLQTSWVTI